MHHYNRIMVKIIYLFQYCRPCISLQFDHHINPVIVAPPIIIMSALTLQQLHVYHVYCSEVGQHATLSSALVFHARGYRARVYFFTEALAEFQHVNCMIVRLWEVKGVACYARAETFTEAVASMV